MSTATIDFPADAILQLIQELPIDLFHRHRYAVNALESVCRAILTTPDTEKSIYSLALDDRDNTDTDHTASILDHDIHEDQNSASRNESRKEASTVKDVKMDDECHDNENNSSGTF